MNNVSKILLYGSLPLMLFYGCGGSEFDEKDRRITGVETQDSSVACVETFYQQNIEFDLSKCVGCHTAGGQAQSTALVFSALTSDNSNANFLTLKNYITATGTKIIQKNDGTVSHAGGALFTDSDITQYSTLINYVNEPSTCIDSSVNVEPVSLSSVRLVSPATTARNAALVTTGEAPSDAELALALTQTGLDNYLDQLMQKDAFYDWLKLRFNDIFLTDRYNRSSDGINLMDSTDFPDRVWYYGTNDNRNMLGESNTTARDIKYNRVRSKTNYGVARAPLELIAHVVREEKNFGEILTADYMMMNPYSSRSFGVNVNGFSLADDDDDELSQFSKDNFRELRIPGIPHAGVLTDPMFLNRFPTTATNRNRHRSTKIQLFFLDTDILGLADRPINSTSDDKSTHNPTSNNPNCTVCHFVMDPIAGALQNWDSRGRYRPMDNGWYPEMMPPGFSLSDRMNASEYPRSMQWLAEKIVADPRFAKASVKLFYKALTGKDALSKPAYGDTYLAASQQAYDFQDKVFEDIKSKFLASNKNAKVIIKELIKSVFFSGRSMTEGLQNEILSNSIGLAHLIEPENLDKKIYNTMGYYWARSYYQDNNSRHYLMNESEYKTLYGGINSNSITKRVSDLNGVMANIQMRMAVEMSCYPVSLDFYRSASTRKLFPLVDKNLEPLDTASIQKIKENIVHLYKQILGETHTSDSAEVERTYQLFYQSYVDGKARVDSGDARDRLNSGCSVQRDPVTNQNLFDADRRDTDLVYYDRAYVIRAWSAVITYMLSDFKFLYENTAE